MWEKLGFIINRARERLWVKPLLVCILSIGGVFVAHLLDRRELDQFLPDITRESNETLLKIIGASMLVMATFAVASMVSAYASASSSATPRSFQLVIADDVSQNALSAFIGAFIFSVVGLIAQINGFYGSSGRFVLFLLTLLVFGIVIVTFVYWVDSIARLGRLGSTIDRVEAAAAAALKRRLTAPRLGGVAEFDPPADSRPIYGLSVGYLQQIDVASLQTRAGASGLRILVTALPGTFCTPDRLLAWVTTDATRNTRSSDAGDRDARTKDLIHDHPGTASDEEATAIAKAFGIGDSRVFDQDPRFGLIVLSEIASRALSPAVNDPGTAIDVIGTLVRIFVAHALKNGTDEPAEVRYDRVAVPELAVADLFDDSFTGIARDGAGTVEVIVRLLKALETLSAIGDARMKASAIHHARLALERAEKAMQVEHDLTAVRKAAAFANA